MSPVLVKLTPEEIIEGSMVGVKRRVYDESKKIGDKHGADRDSYARQWLYEITGAIAEKAVAKYFGIEWDGSLGNFQAKDVGNFQIRSTQKRWHRLHLRLSDSDTDIFIKVSVEEPHLFNHGVVIEGWAYGRDVKQDRYWEKIREDRPAQYLYPNDKLRDISEIKVSRGQNGRQNSTVDRPPVRTP